MILAAGVSIRRSKQQEKEGAERFGGTQNSNSGAGWVRKGDVRTPTELVEFKTTAAKSYQLKYADLDLETRQALLDDRIMVFGLVILAEDDYLELSDRIEVHVT